MVVGQVRGSLLTLTIVNLSWHAMKVSIQVTAVAVRRGITAAALGEAEPSRLATCASRASHGNEWQMLGGGSNQDAEA